jgi:hypothetical protein
MRAMRLPLLLVVLLLTGCASQPERWAEAVFDDISYPALYGVLVTTVDAEGFAVRDRDPQTAEMHSEWVYGTSRRVVRGPARRRVHATIEELDVRSFRVRLRVEEEVVRKGGMLATNVRESENWEPFEDNFDDAEYLMAKMDALLQAHRARAVAP